jgi:hypothetical protein
MNRLYRYSLLGVLVLGLVFAAEGAMLWIRTDYGATTRNWITPQSRIPGKGYMWTWGVEGNPRAEPDEWHFHVMFAANRTADIILFWKLNESVLYERSSAQIDESFDVALPRTTESWRWDWLIRNPHDSVLSVENFTVVHYSMKYPERQIGSLVLGSGVIALLAVPIAIAYLRRRDIRRRSRNSSQSS